MKSNEVFPGTRARIKDNRYKKLKAFITDDSKTPDDIKAEFARLKMKPTEISKLDAKEVFMRGGIVNEKVLQAIRPDVLEKMVSNEAEDGVRIKIKEAIIEGHRVNPIAYGDLMTWLGTNGGRRF